MRRSVGRSLFLALVALVAATVLVLRTDAAGEQACRLLRRRLPGVMGGEVGVGRCRIDPVRGAVEVVGFNLTPRGADEPRFAADRILVSLRAFDVLSGRVRLDRVEVERPRLRLAPQQSVARAGPAGRPAAGCALDGLARIEVDALTITGAQVHLTDGAGRAADLEEADVDLHRSGKTYIARLAVARGGVSAGGVRLPLTRLRGAASLDVDGRRLGVQRLELSAGELSAIVRGEVKSLCAPVFDAEVVVSTPLDLVAALVGSRSPRMSGSILVDASLTGALVDPAVQADVTLTRAQVNQYDIGDAEVSARWVAGAVAIDALKVRVGDGLVRGKGTVGLSGALPVEGSVDLSGVEFARVLAKLGVPHPWPNFAADGRVEVKGQLSPFRLAGPVSIDARDFHVWDRGFDRPGGVSLLELDVPAHVELTVDFNAQRVRMSRVHLTTERSSLDADVTLAFDPNKGIDLEANVAGLELSEMGHLLGVPWEGRLRGKASVRGPYHGPEIAGSVAATDFRFHKLALGDVEADVRFKMPVLAFPAVRAQKGRTRFLADGELELRPGGPYARGRASFESGHMRDLVEAVGDEHWIFDLLRGRMEARVSGAAVVEGPLFASTSTVTLAMSEATYFDRELGAGSFEMHVERGHRLQVRKLSFDGPCGPLSLSGFVEIGGGGMDFAIRAPALKASELGKPDAQFLAAGGTLAVSARLTSEAGGPAKLDGTVVARDLEALNVPLGSGTLALGLDGTQLSLKGPVGPDLLLDARVAVEGELPFAVGVSANAPDLTRYLVRRLALRGALAGELLATGTLKRYRETRGDLWLETLQVGRGDYLAKNDGPVQVSFDGAAVQVRSLSLKGPTGTRLLVGGLKEADGTLDLSVDGAFDVRLIESLTPWIEQSAGRVQLSASVGGTLERLAIVGTAKIDGGRFGVRGFPVAAKGVAGRVEFSQNRVFVDDVGGTVNNGRFVVRGDVGLAGFVPTRFDLGALLDEVGYKVTEAMPSVVSGELRLYGPLDSLVLAGDVDVVKLRYTQDIADPERMLRDYTHRGVHARSFEKRDEIVRYDVALHVNGDARVDNNLAKAAFKGELKLVGTNAHMGLLGSLDASGGGRAFFRGNEFSVTQATVDFSERDRVEPGIDLHAEGQVRDYKVHVHAWGPLASPQVDLSSEPELMRADVVTLLTLGFTSRDKGQDSARAEANILGELINMSGLDKQVRRFIPKNQIIRDFNFHISTQYSEASGLVEPTAQIESRFLTDALRLRLSQPLSQPGISGRGRRAQAEYRFNDHVSAQAQWDAQGEGESGGYSLGDLGLDLKLRWELN